MALQASDSVDYNTSVFGRERWLAIILCSWPRLRPMWTYCCQRSMLLCSDYGIDEIIEEADSLSQECFYTLIRGRESLDFQVHRLLSGLPEDLMEYIENDSCSGNKPCFRNARYTRMSELINYTFRYTKGSQVVARHLSPVCPSCGSFVASAIDDKRKEIWANVPSYYGFPSWDIIQAKLKENHETSS